MTPKIDELVSRRVREAPPPRFVQPPVPVTYDFDQGVPAPELYPLEDLARYAATALEKFGPSALAYAGGGYDELTYGPAGLREVLAERIQEHQARDLGSRGVMMFNGSAQGLGTLAAAFCDPGDGVVVEALSFPFMVGYLASTGAEIATVDIDDEGIDVDSLERVFDSLEERGVKPKLLYTIPTYQVPTGTCMPLKRREQLIELIQQRGVIVVEDNCYYDIYYDQPPPPTLLSLDDSGLVIQSDSFSKILAPGLRMGWVAGDPEAVAAAGVARQDLGVSGWLARALELYVSDGKLDTHIDELRAAYRRKRDIALSALQEHCAPWVRFRIPEGGIYFWLEMSDDVDWDAVKERVAEEGVACRPGERYSGDESGRRFLRVAYLQVPEEEITRGVQALARALAASSR